MAATSCGTDALIFGSFIMLASGLLANSPSSDSASVTRWSWVKFSGKFASILDASDMSLVSMAILEGEVNDFTIGKKEWVAKNGASSVLVYIILTVLLIEFFFFWIANIQI